MYYILLFDDYLHKINIRSSGSGVILETAKARYALDKVKEDSTDFHIISHAHTDHLPRRVMGKPVMSNETKHLAISRGVRGLDDGIIDTDKIKLIDSGHILGSTAALIEDEILYTGDFSMSDRFFLKGFKPPKAKVLIMEATYGHSRYKFQNFEDIVNETLEYVFERISEGYRLMAYGYALGKSQLLTKLFSWYDKLIVSDSVKKYNDIYQELNVDLGNSYISLDDAKTKKILDNDQWILITERNKYSKEIIAQKYGVITLDFTGWRIKKQESNNFYGVPLSDHADYNDLIEVVKQVDPEEIYLMCGFTDNFASDLREIGFKAFSVNSKQRYMSEF